MWYSLARSGMPPWPLAAGATASTTSDWGMGTLSLLDLSEAFLAQLHCHILCLLIAVKVCWWFFTSVLTNCTTGVGYNISQAIESTLNIHPNWGNPSAAKSTGLVSMMVLHPIACFLAAIAFVSSLRSDSLSTLITTLVALLAWLLTFVVLTADIHLFRVCFPAASSLAYYFQFFGAFPPSFLFYSECRLIDNLRPSVILWIIKTRRP